MKSENHLKAALLSISSYAALFLFVVVLVFAATAHCQVSVAMAPPIHFQFLNASGQPLANGKIYTYQAGTTICQNSYVDASGTTQNACPIPLDATGSPSNGSTQTGIFLSNTSWKFVAYDVNNAFQWSVDNVTTYFALLNSTNTWSATQTFSVPIVDTDTDNQFVLGSPGNQTTVDFPPPAGNVTVHFPNITDTVVARTTTDTLTNKTLTSPTINGGTQTNVSLVTPTINSVPVADSPGTYVSIANASPTGTTANALVKLINAPSNATIAATTDTSGIVGICLSACGNTGSAIIQASGTANCIFDAAVNAGDYVVPSPNTAGDCHDFGAEYPSATQALGRVLVTNAAPGTYAMLLYGSDVKIPGSALGIVQVANAGVTGTTLFTLTKLTGAPSTAVIAASGDKSGIVGITVAGAGTAGIAQIQQSGLASCVFDGATTAGDYVQISATTTGDCHDAGATFPTVNQVIGRVLTTNGSNGTYQMMLYAPDYKSPGTAFVQSGVSTGCGATCTFTYPIAYSSVISCVCSGEGGSCNIASKSATQCVANTTVGTVDFLVTGNP